MPTNPNPERISGPLWTLTTRLTDLTPTAFVDEFGGIWVRQKGSHADAGWLKANYPNDYSLQGELQQLGPQQYGRALDWTFPSAQRGDWSEIGVFSGRLHRAWENWDPRTYGLFEVLCQTAEDAQPEGFVFYPDHRFRVPDDSHQWHLHIGILTAYIDDAVAMDAIYSIFAGEPLEAWRKRLQADTEDDDMKLRLVTVRTESGALVYGGAVFLCRSVGTAHWVQDPAELHALVAIWDLDPNPVTVTDPRAIGTLEESSAIPPEWDPA